jgi:Lar family restriction alleviation protein
MSSLLPCPFCGSTEVSLSHTVQGFCWVVCDVDACGAAGPMKPTPAEAASAWNTRVSAVGDEAGVALSEDSSPEVVLPVDMESRLVGDIAGFRASDVDLRKSLTRASPAWGVRLRPSRAISSWCRSLGLLQRALRGSMPGGVPHHRRLPDTAGVFYRECFAQSLPPLGEAPPSIPRTRGPQWWLLHRVAVALVGVPPYTPRNVPCWCPYGAPRSCRECVRRW